MTRDVAFVRLRRPATKSFITIQLPWIMTFGHDVYAFGLAFM